MSDYNDGILPEPCLRMDTHFGYEYESIEFGDGTGYIKAAPILAKVGALHEEIDRLRDENAELRKMLDLVPNCDACEAMQDCWECLRADASHHERKRLSVENAKLRELVRDLYQCSRQCGCDRCGYKDGCAMFDRMAQLGVDA